MSKYNKYDIGVRIKFKGDIVPSELVEEMVDDIESAIYESEEQDLYELFKNSSNIQIPQVVKDACLYRIEKYRGDSLILESTKKGSFIVEGVVAGLSYWLLENTLGETFKDAWKETELHQQIKKFFLSKRQPKDNIKAEKIASKIPRTTRRHGYKENREIQKATVSTQITYENCTIINVTVEQNIMDKLPPKFSSLIDKNISNDYFNKQQ